jgi:hypothetical protein
MGSCVLATVEPGATVEARKARVDMHKGSMRCCQGLVSVTVVKACSCSHRLLVVAANAHLVLFISTIVSVKSVAEDKDVVGEY